FHIEIFASRARSYRELPLRMAELAAVYRYQRSGTLQGLLRVRGFTQDDAHIFCTEEQVESEVEQVLELVARIYARFGFHELEVDLSTRPEKAVGSEGQWRSAEATMERVLERTGLPYRINPREGAFYGPKVDVQIRDALGRRWQCATVQFDFNEPQRFQLEYIGPDGQAHQPVMVHRTVLGSLERFTGVLLEHHAGALPLWLAPVQIQVLTVTDEQLDYAHQVAAELERAGLRVEVPDHPGVRPSAKIRQSQLAKVPYAAVVGAREVAEGNVNLRDNRRGEQRPLQVAEVVERLLAEATS
ncbi:MAG: threonine--tRNA ligase, partial [Candidatus Dormibacteria bacterium]